MRGIELIIAFPSFLIAFSLIYLYGSKGSITVGVEQLLHLNNVPFQLLYTPFAGLPNLILRIGQPCGPACGWG